jgi:tetratricopeptide (TPR) repeat protein
MRPMDIEQELKRLWASLGSMREEQFRARMDELAKRLPPPVAAYERGPAWDSTGHSDRAVPLYREALELGLGEDRRRQCVIQLASSLRNLGEARESVALLSEEVGRRSDELDDALCAFLALALVSAGREREAVAVAVTQLASHRERYQRSLNHYAAELTAAG